MEANPYIYMYMYLQFPVHSYFFYPDLEIMGISVYWAPFRSRLPWKHWRNALQWKWPQDTNLSPWCWHWRRVLLSRGGVRGAIQRGPWQSSTPERSTLELLLWGANPDVRSVSEVGSIPLPVNLCSDSSGCSIGMSVSLYTFYSSNFISSKIRISCRSLLMISILRFIMLNSNALLWVTDLSQLWALPGPRLPV